MFPRYLFVQLDESSSNFGAVKNTRGVSDFVRYGQQLQKVPEYLIEALQSPAQAQIEEVLYQAGDIVQITQGCYRHLQAIYKEPDGAMRSVLLIKLLNQEVELSLENNSITKVSESFGGSNHPLG